MTTRLDIVTEVRSYVGTPFHHQASLPGVGMDCIGELRSLGRRLNLQGSKELEAASHLLAYGPDPNPALLRECVKYLDPITWAQVGLADILMMKTLYSNGEPKHFAVISRVDPFYIVHAWAPGKGEVIENRLDEKWRGRVLSCWRFRGIDG